MKRARHGRGARVNWRAVLACTALLVSRTLQSDDWPGFLGPYQNLTSSERINTRAPGLGLAERWTIPMSGYGGFAVRAGRAYALSQDTGGDQEVCVALDAATGKVLWSIPVGKILPGNKSDSTPVLADGRVLTLSSDLHLWCLDPETGKVLWSVDLAKDYAAQQIYYGSAASPLVHNGLVLINSNSVDEHRLLAVRVTNGTLVWRAQAGAPEHATPVLAVIHGVPQALFYTLTDLVALSPDTGEILWRQSLECSPKASPVVAQEIVFYTDSFAGAAVRVTKSESGLSGVPLWSQRNLGSYYCTPVFHDGYIYGLFGSGFLKCVDPSTGEVVWSASGPEFRAGGLIAVGNHLLIQGASGGLVVAEASPVAYKEITRLSLFDTDQGYNHPAISSGSIYLRSLSQATCWGGPNSAPAQFSLRPPQRLDDGRVLLTAASADGGSLPPERSSKIVWLTTTNLGAPLQTWEALTNAPPGGASVQVQKVPGGVEPQRFFSGMELP